MADCVKHDANGLKFIYMFWDITYILVYWFWRSCYWKPLLPHTSNMFWHEKAQILPKRCTAIVFEFLYSVGLSTEGELHAHISQSQKQHKHFYITGLLYLFCFFLWKLDFFLYVASKTHFADLKIFFFQQAGFFAELRVFFGESETKLWQAQLTLQQ